MASFFERANGIKFGRDQLRAHEKKPTDLEIFKIVCGLVGLLLNVFGLIGY